MFVVTTLVVPLFSATEVATTNQDGELNVCRDEEAKL